jgi:hypothetical protein
MKSLHLVLITLFFTVSQSYSQVEVNKISHNGRDRYITTTIGYPIPGVYIPMNQKEPSTVLNPDGTGVIQAEDLSKSKMNWGIECTEEGVPILEKASIVLRTPFGTDQMTAIFGLTLNFLFILPRKKCF